jgi:hypothetical protein
MLSLTRALLTRWTSDFVEIIYTDHLGDLRSEDPDSDVRHLLGVLGGRLNQVIRKASTLGQGSFVW